MDFFTEIQTIICIGENIPASDLHLIRSKTRKREFVLSRQLVMYFLKKVNPEFTLATIGWYYKKDHATVMHAFKTIDNLIETDKEFAKKFLDYKLRIDLLVHFERTLVIDEIAIAKDQLMVLIEKGVPVPVDLIGRYNALLFRSENVSLFTA